MGRERGEEKENAAIYTRERGEKGPFARASHLRPLTEATQFLALFSHASGENVST